MVIPKRVPGLKVAVVILGLFLVLWIALEGDIRWSAIMTVSLIIAACGYILQRFFGGKKLANIQGLGLFGLLGLAAGLIFTPAILMFMSIKTGLHGHGPEFSQREIIWILDRIVLWAVVGLLAGLGIALLILGFRQRDVEI